MKRLIIYVLALLGYTFVSCDPDEGFDIDNPAPMYAPIQVEYSKKPLADEALAQEANNDTQNS